MRKRDQLKHNRRFDAYKKQRNYVLNLVQKVKNTYFSQLVKDNRDTSSIWKAINSITRENSKTCDISASNIPPDSFNDHFFSVSTKLLQREIDRQTDRQTDRQAGRQAGRHAGRQADRQTDRQTGRQTDRQTDTQTDRHTDRQTDTVVCWLLHVPATCKCISGTDLHRRVYVLTHRDRSHRSTFLPHPVTVY